MADSFIGEIRQMSFAFTPKGWAPCNGQLMKISGAPALYSLLGTKFGGDGETTFGLPDLRGRTPIHAGDGYALGQMGGEQTHTLSLPELPAHTHGVAAQTSANGGQATPLENVLGGANNAYAAPNGTLQALRADTVSTTGASQAHQNLQPYMAMNFCIATQGGFPSAT